MGRVLTVVTYYYSHRRYKINKYPVGILVELRQTLRKRLVWRRQDQRLRLQIQPLEDVRCEERFGNLLREHGTMCRVIIGRRLHLAHKPYPVVGDGGIKATN